MSDSTVFVYTMNQYGKVGAWSRYVYPFQLEYFTQLGNDLYGRAGNTVYRFDANSVYDNEVSGTGDPFAGIIWWPWLDFGAPGTTKQMVGFDLTGTGQVNVQFGFNQRDITAFTQSWTVDADTLPDGVLPMPLAAPTISVKLTFSGGQQWEWQAFNAYFQDFRITS